MASLRQSFLNGSLTRLIDPDHTLRVKVLEFVERGDFGFASGPKPDGSYDRVWFQEMMAPDEVTFDSGVVLLAKATAAALQSGTPVRHSSDDRSDLDAADAGPHYRYNPAHYGD